MERTKQWIMLFGMVATAPFCSAQLQHDSDGNGCVGANDLLVLLSEYGTCNAIAPEVYYFHGGNQSYPFVQAAGGLTDPNPGTLYYDDGSGNTFAATTSLSVAMSYVMDNMGVSYAPGNFDIESLPIPEGGITALGSGDELVFSASTSAEYYYVIAPEGEVDLTTVTPQHLVDGGIPTNAVQKAIFTWNGSNYWLYRLGGGAQTLSRTITFSDLD